MTLITVASRGLPGRGASGEDLEAKLTEPWHLLGICSSSERTPPQRCCAVGSKRGPREVHLPRTAPKPALLTLCLFWLVVSEALRCWGLRLVQPLLCIGSVPVRTSCGGGCRSVGGQLCILITDACQGLAMNKALSPRQFVDFLLPLFPEKKFELLTFHKPYFL